MRVGLISGEYPPMEGGIGDYTRALAQALAPLGPEVQVLTSRRAAPRRERASPGPGDGPGVVVHPIVAGWGFASWRVLRAWIREARPHILHLQYQTAAFGMHPAINLWPLALRFLPSRPAFITTFHDLRLPYLFPKAGPLRSGVNRWLALGSDAVVASNAQDALRLAAWGVGSQRLAIIPLGNAIPVAPPLGYRREAWRGRLGVGPGEALLCFFGFMNSSKGLEDLLHALRRTVDRGLACKLLLLGASVGEVDPSNVTYRRQMQGLIEALGLGERVLWTGHLPAAEVSAGLLAADLCVLPFRDGGSYRRTSLITVLAHGCPLITTLLPHQDGPGRSAPRSTEEEGLLPPPLRHGEHCLLVPPRAPEALALALEELASSAQLRGQLSQGARALAEHFAWERVAPRTLRLYERVLGAAEAGFHG